MQPNNKSKVFDLKLEKRKSLALLWSAGRPYFYQKAFLFPFEALVKRKSLAASPLRSFSGARLERKIENCNL
ncbi:MAG: hypothetical protein CL840_18120 [Crocinitomicaceae bacterium]|nr:hypothetical protein [Crocinitomicaceae bacterium]|tara:strand:- start:18833 stop:19048 length:216 start_codon:yes stop_codon:yes gene_type:complete